MAVYDASDEDFVDDPYPVYRRMRDEAPAYRDPETGYWLITRYADIEQASADYRTFSSSRGNTVVDSPTRVGKSLGTLDPPRHDELRRIVQRSLSPSRIDQLMPLIRENTRAHLAAIRDRGGSADLVADFGRPVMFDGLGRLLGLDEAASERATELISGLFHQRDGLMGPVLPNETFREIAGFLDEELKKRTVEPGEDLFSVLLAAQAGGAPMSDAEIAVNMSTVLLAGSASIGHFLPNLFHALWLFPDQRRLVLDDPSLIPALIEEAVRWDTSTQCFARQTMVDTPLAGTLIPADSRVILFFASANRDERAIPDPDMFDIRRKRLRHFGFGMGPHVCAGSNVARSMLRVMLEEALPFFGAFDLDVANARRVEHIMVRGFIDLPITAGRA